MRFFHPSRSSVPLPFLDRRLLGLALTVVPHAERAEWQRLWQAELWHRHNLRCGEASSVSSAADLYPGLVCDAVWLRMESVRVALRGTPLLCVGLLLGVLLFAALPLMVFVGGSSALAGFLSFNVPRFVCEAGLVTLVSFATASRMAEHASPAGLVSRFRTQVFLAVKLVLVLVIAFVLSLDGTELFHAAHPFLMEVLQPQLFVLMALMGLRWNFEDQENRCKCCLHELSMPERVGRPSWNFLDSNGTELQCKDGHGLLSVPEMETSWRRSSRWIAM